MSFTMVDVNDAMARIYSDVEISLEPIDQMNIERLKAQIPAVRVSFHHIVTSDLRMRMIHND